MTNKKKQHYVPQFYMRNFANKNEKFNIYHVRNKFIKLDIPVRGQCQLNNYYDKKGDKDWENKLSKYESTWATTIRKIIKEECIVLTQEEKISIITFAIFQNSRSTQARDAFIGKNWEMMKITDSMSLKNMINEGNEKQMKDQFKEISKEAPALLLDTAEKASKYLTDLDVKVIQYNTNNQLISSDNPIIYSNKIYPNVGLSIAGILICFPISNKHYIVIYDKKIYKNENNYAISTNESEVKKLNKYQLIVSNDLIFGLDQYTFTKPEALMKICKSDREKFWQSIMTVTTLGTAKEKMISFSTPMLKNMSTHSFNRLTTIGRNIVDISLTNRDWFPRSPYVDDSSHSRLSNKLSLASIPHPKIKKNLSTKEIKKFNRLVENYWI